MPATTQESAPVESGWISFEKSVLEAHKRNGVAGEYAIERWRKRVQQIREEYGVRVIVHEFKSPQVLEAARKYQICDIAEFEAIYQVKLAREALGLAERELRLSLAQQEGFFLSEDEDESESLVPEMLAVVRRTKADEIKRLREVVEFARQLALSDNGDSLSDLPRPKGPGLTEFTSDLVEFIEVSGEAGRATVARICESVDVAVRLKEDPQVPKLLRALAGIVVETNGYSLSGPRQQMGFRPPR